MRHGLRLIVGGLLLVGLAACSAAPKPRAFVPSGHAVPKFQMSPLASGDALGLACASAPKSLANQ